MLHIFKAGGISMALKFLLALFFFLPVLIQKLNIFYLCNGQHNRSLNKKNKPQSTVT